MARTLSATLRSIAVKIKESVEPEAAMATAERMLEQLTSVPEKRIDLVPGVSLEFRNDMPQPNFYPPNSVILYKDSEQWQKQQGKPWQKIQ